MIKDTRTSQALRPRKLGVESLERRDLLAVALVPGTETFKSFEFTSWSPLDVRGTWRVYEPRVYNIPFAGKTTVFHGTANYISRDQATVEVDTVEASGSYFLPAPYRNGRFSLTGGTITNGATRPVPGKPNFFEGQLGGDVRITGQINDEVALDGPITGSFNGAKQALDLQYLDTDVRLRVKGSIRPLSVEPFRVAVQNATWTAQALEVDVVAPGGVSKSPNHNSPVAFVRLYWAAGTDFAQKLQMLNDKLPVYWNQASGKYSVTMLSMPPTQATHLLLVPEYKNVIGKTVRGDIVALALPDKPGMSVHNAMIEEGNRGTKALEFQVTLSSPLPFSILVSFVTIDQTAKVKDGDYIRRSGKVLFAAGETTKTLTVQVRGDRKVETDETFGIKLSGPTWATIATPVGVGTILNDDTPPAALDVALQGVERPDPAAELASVLVAGRRKTTKTNLSAALDAAFV